MSDLKTKPTRASVKKFLNAVEHPTRKTDALALEKLFTELTQTKPKMWGESLVGYGQYDYVYKTGHSGRWLITGFSPRKQNLVVYLMSGFSGMESLFEQLGKHKLGKCCVYINTLDDIDLEVLKKLIQASIQKTLSLYEGKMA